MADNITLRDGNGNTFTAASDDVGGVQYQTTKMAVGGDGTVAYVSSGTGNTDSGTIRVAIGGEGEYETVAASQTAQTLGPTGAVGDYIAGLLIIPATTSPGNVLLLDNATSMTVFAGGSNSVSNLVPFFVPLGMISVSGAWKVTTGTNVSVIATGNFT